MKAMAVLCVLFLVGCGEQASWPANEERVLEMTGVSFSISVPPSAKVRQAARPAAVAVVDFRPGHRQPKTITFWHEDKPQHFPQDNVWPKARRLNSRASLRYRTEKTAGGSGGEEAVLMGVLTIENVALEVECHFQSELPPPNPEWCIGTLRTIRVLSAD